MAQDEWVDVPKGHADEWVDVNHHDLTQAPEKFNAAQSAVMHGLQGATGGFMDEIQGLGEAAGRVAGVKGAGGPMKDMGIAPGGPTLDWQTLRDAYKAARDHERESLALQDKEHPIASGAGNLVGMVASPLNKVASGLSLAKGGAVLGGINGLGSSDAEDVSGMAKDAAIGTGAGLALGGAADKLSSTAGKAAAYLSSKTAQKAEKLAVNATGATGIQATKFADDAGRQLLDRGLVKFGDTPTNVAHRVGGAMEDAGNEISQSLESLNSKGVTASADSVVAKLESRIAELEKDPSQSGVVKKLRSIVDDVVQTGESNVPIKDAEATKRGFSKMAGNWMDPDVGQAGKQAYLSYMDEVERAATAADPTLASTFAKGKETYGLLAPIEEAASKRASTLNQSPWGGLGDMVAAGAGSAGAGPAGAVAGMIGKKMIAPRLTSSAATSLDGISKMLMGSPRMASLAKSNPQAFSSLATRLAERAGESLPKAASNNNTKPDFVTKPIDDKDAKSSFLEGN